ncbi:zinc finger MYM-type protein 1-like [Prorops nasuta]|uniref:zinc finger MYM-type protein 1-like n=1 Tax=Prorops nasuta TaxID=863751 RepID=UPI0034D00423
MSRKYDSGAQKRKIKRNKELFQSKLPKLTTYFTHDEESIRVSQVKGTNESEEKDASIYTSEDANESCNNISANKSDCATDFVESISVIISEDIIQDPALWPKSLHVNKSQRVSYLDKGHEFFQNKNSNFKSSKRVYKNQSRYFSHNYFYRKLSNDEKCERKWIIFSESTGNIFCYACKLFSTNQTNVFVQKGFCNWKKAEEVIVGHENSVEHCRCMLMWNDYMHLNMRIDHDLENVINNEISYWCQVLKRVVAVVRFLAERGLSFRGTHEVIGSSNNGNYLGILELLAEFDPFLKMHIEKYANKGTGYVSYLSKTIYEEFIVLMARKILNKIKEEIIEAKYWALIVDSTPDITHVDQLSIILRYYLNGHVYDRFFCFIKIKSHTGKSLSIEIENLLKEHSIELQNCRAQTYDNASNMSGKYLGLQACIKEKNRLSHYVPCIGHSLNLVGENSVDECVQSCSFFGLLQALFTFFSASTHRWDVLKSHEKGKLTSLSKTRWSCKIDAINDLTTSYDSIHNALSELAADESQKSEAKHEAKSLLNK